MKYIEIKGDASDKELDLIRKNIEKDSNSVFLYTGFGTIYDYIETIGRDLGDELLYRFKICYEKRGLKAEYSDNTGNGKKMTQSMGELIKNMDREHSCRIVIESNKRTDLAFVVQQLIYIDFPVDKLDILLRKEEKDAAKTKRFMNKINKLAIGCENAISGLGSLKTELENGENTAVKADMLKDVELASESLKKIYDEVKKASNIELKLAVAASKKTGKSVIVNGFLGEEIAPTSVELATPNNCIYRKSKDNKYYLQMEGEDTKQEFDRVEDINRAIDEMFRHAQNDKDNKFKIPDMHIDYPTEENNFSSYTIYDTAGPDAAGTGHWDVAQKAMNECDVVIFAIDYSKYLTTSEEEYLNKVKTLFTNQNKFHSLMFALNKIDVRYDDPKAFKSIIRSVDFIKHRLVNIDKKYEDCIIFPTCSLEYYNAIEAEKAGVDLPEEKIDMREFKRLDRNRRDVPAVHWLYNYADNLEYYHGIEEFNYNTFKQDSRMPALMNYASYVAKSKARDEIVGNVAYEISAQRENIRTVVNNVSNIEKLIGFGEDKIEEIKTIIDEYSSEVKNILNSRITDDDLSVINEGILKYSKGNTEYIKEYFTDNLKKTSYIEDMVMRAKSKIYNNISRREVFKANDVDNLFNASDANEVVNEVLEMKLNQTSGNFYSSMSSVKSDIIRIVEYRQQRLKSISDKCKEKLEQMEVILDFPELPEFEFNAPLAQPNRVDFTINFNKGFLFDDLKELFPKTFWGKVVTFFNKSKESVVNRKYIGGGAGKFDETWREHNLDGKLMDVFRRNVDINHAWTNNVVNTSIKYLGRLTNGLNTAFSRMNKTLGDNIERFRSSLDNSDMYREEIKLQKYRKDNIEKIEKCTAEFMSAWDEIIKDL